MMARRIQGMGRVPGDWVMALLKPDGKPVRFTTAMEMAGLASDTQLADPDMVKRLSNSLRFELTVCGRSTSCHEYARNGAARVGRRMAGIDGLPEKFLQAKESDFHYWGHMASKFRSASQRSLAGQELKGETGSAPSAVSGPSR